MSINKAPWRVAINQLDELANSSPCQNYREVQRLIEEAQAELEREFAQALLVDALEDDPT